MLVKLAFPLSKFFPREKMASRDTEDECLAKCLLLQKLHRSSKYWHKPNIPKIIENAAADRIPIRLGNAAFEKFGIFGKILGMQMKL